MVFLREGFSLGKDDYLSCECQAGTETNLQGELAGEFRVLLEQAVRGEGDRCGGGVTGIDDVACHCHRVGKLEGS